MSGAFWEAPPQEPPKDILAEERARPRRSLFRFMLPGSWLKGRSGAAIMGVFVLAGLGWILLPVRDWVGLETTARPAISMMVHPDSGRELTGAEYADARRYGRPLYLGDRGLPVVEHGFTGEVRELTPVEIEFEEGLPYRKTDYGRVVWTPGPRGWGIWWEDDSEVRALEASTLFIREGWREKQREELGYALAQVSEGLLLVKSMDFELWRPGIGPSLYAHMRDLKRRYPVVQYGHWTAVPGQWRCDFQLESDLNQGVTQGCPAVEYEDSLGAAWSHLGVVVEMLEGMGRVAVQMDGLSAENLYQSELMGVMTYRALDLTRAVRALELALDELWLDSSAVDLTISVGLFQE